MMRSVALILGCLCAVAVSQSELEFEVGEGGHYHRPETWTRVREASCEDAVELIIAVKHTEEQEIKLEKTLLAVSDVTSDMWGKHLSLSEVNNMMQPTEARASTIRKWLAGCGETHPVDTDLIKLVVSAPTAECLLQAKYHVWEMADDAGKVETILRLNGTYKVPTDAVDFVRPSVAFPSLRTGRLRVTSPADLINDPKNLRKLYNADGLFGTKGKSGVVQGFANFLGQHWDATDFSEFQRLFLNWTTPYNITQVFGPNKGLPGGEASLDSQYITGVTGASVETWSYTTAGAAPTNPANEPWLTWMWTLGNQTKIPITISASYGEDEKSVGYDYARRNNVEFQKVGVRGTSLLISSGDSGAGGNCTVGGRLTPNFPADSPWVTAIGGLVGGTPGAEPTGEEGDNISSGGFSDWWGRPSWQDDAVAEYVKSNVSFPKKDRWNQTGAGFPDIAFQSEDFIIVDLLIPQPVAGTSCAAPTGAGLFSLINEDRAAKGKGSLGFLNPLLYKLATTTPNAFNDALSGTNFGCSGFKPGFTATKGWDAVTGLGSINVKNFIAAVDSMERIHHAA